MGIKKIIASVILGAADIAVFFGAYRLFTYLNEDYWFLRHENQPVQRFMMVAGIVLAAVVLLAAHVAVIRLWIKKKNTDNSQVITEPVQPANKVDSYTAEDYIRIFHEVKEKKPSLSGLIDEAMNQIDTFYDDKEAIDRIMRIQNISYAPILHAIQQSETNVLKTMKSLLVDISAWNPKRISDESRKEAYTEVYESIQKKLEINKKNLQSFHDLLMRVRTLKTDEVAEDNTIQALIRALESAK